MYNARLEILHRDNFSSTGHHYQHNFIGHISILPSTNQRYMKDDMKKHFYAFVIALTRQNFPSYIYINFILDTVYLKGIFFVETNLDYRTKTIQVYTNIRTKSPIPLNFTSRMRCVELITTTIYLRRFRII